MNSLNEPPLPIFEYTKKNIKQDFIKFSYISSSVDQFCLSVSSACEK
jgi:hypothetical protein